MKGIKRERKMEGEKGAREGERERSNFLFLEGHQLYWIRLNLITSFSFSYPLKTISSNAALFMDKALAMNLRGIILFFPWNLNPDRTNKAKLIMPEPVAKIISECWESR